MRLPAKLSLSVKDNYNGIDRTTKNNIKSKDILNRYRDAKKDELLCSSDDEDFDAVQQKEDEDVIEKCGLVGDISHRKKIKMEALNNFQVRVKKYEESLYRDFD